MHVWLVVQPALAVHAAHVCVLVAQYGVAPEQSASSPHCTQAPAEHTPLAQRVV
jgi:hypothetical protein